MAGDLFYGFDLHERKTLINLFQQLGLLAEGEADLAQSVLADMQIQIADLDARVTALEP